MNLQNKGGNTALVEASYFGRNEVVVEIVETR